MLILFRILYVTVFLGVIFLIIFFNISRLSGTVSVTVNGERYPVERVECMYEDGSEEKVTYRTMTRDSQTGFKNEGNHYGMYEYIFFINHEEINIEPKICLFKTNWYKMNVMDIDIKIYGDNGVWNADVSVETKFTMYQETFYDIENNGIEMRVE